MINRIYIIASIVILLLTNCTSTKEMINNKSISNLDINRYLGKWYEIARYPHSFEKGLVGVTATYSLENNGKIKVLNSGYKNTLDGEFSEATGKAKVPNPQEPGHLRVAFFWIFYADYLVMELDTVNYQWAVVGSSSSKYLWILSRTPQMDDKIYADLLNRIEKRGYSLDNLMLVEQPIL